MQEMAEAQFPLPAMLQHPSSAPPQLITQGAEARLYKSTYLLPTVPCAVKHRPSKTYRHPVLDARLTRQRILAEARILARCRREGVGVPAVLGVDEASGVLVLEWIEGEVVRVAVNSWVGSWRGGRSGEREGEAELKGLLRRMGEAVGRLHSVGIIHGDLTTSNMMLRPAGGEPAVQEGKLAGEVVIIDFGLAVGGMNEEDRAVDLYVLEKAFGSTHPTAEDLFGEVLEGYRGAFKSAGVVLKRLDEVRLRGRKRSMLG